MAMGLPQCPGLTPSEQAPTSRDFTDAPRRMVGLVTFAFPAMASWVHNTAVSQAEPSSTALSLLRHSKRLLQSTQVFAKSPYQLLERTQVVQCPFQEKGSPEVQNQHVIPLREQNSPLLQGAVQETGEDT